MQLARLVGRREADLDPARGVAVLLEAPAGELAADPRALLVLLAVPARELLRLLLPPGLPGGELLLLVRRFQLLPGSQSPD